MKRDMDLIRKIMLKIEEEYRSSAIINLSIDGYDRETVAYHCRILNDAGFVSDYEGRYASDQLYMFWVGPLTWEGNDFLDKIRDDGIWHKTKEVITKKGLPLIVDTIKTIANSFITAAAEGVANSILKNGGT